MLTKCERDRKTETNDDDEKMRRQSDGGDDNLKATAPQSICGCDATFVSVDANFQQAKRRHLPPVRALVNAQFDARD